MTLTIEQLEALKCYAAKHGRGWKRQLVREWTKSSVSGVNDDDKAILHGLRNDSRFGPGGLVSFRFPKEQMTPEAFQAIKERIKARDTSDYPLQMAIDRRELAKEVERLQGLLNSEAEETT